MRERNIDRLPLIRTPSNPGICANQNQTGDPSLYRTTPNKPSYTDQGSSPLHSFLWLESSVVHARTWK